MAKVASLYYDTAYKLYCRSRVENMLALELREHITAFEEEYPEAVQRAGL